MSVGGAGVLRRLEPPWPRASARSRHARTREHVGQPERCLRWPSPPAPRKRRRTTGRPARRGRTAGVVAVASATRPRRHRRTSAPRAARNRSVWSRDARSALTRDRNSGHQPGQQHGALDLRAARVVLPPIVRSGPPSSSSAARHHRRSSPARPSRRSGRGHTRHRAPAQAGIADEAARKRVRGAHTGEQSGRRAAVAAMERSARRVEPVASPSPVMRIGPSAPDESRPRPRLGIGGIATPSARRRLRWPARRPSPARPAARTCRRPARRR